MRKGTVYIKSWVEHINNNFKSASINVSQKKEKVRASFENCVIFGNYKPYLNIEVRRTG